MSEEKLRLANVEIVKTAPRLDASGAPSAWRPFAYVKCFRQSHDPPSAAFDQPQRRAGREHSPPLSLPSSGREDR